MNGYGAMRAAAVVVLALTSGLWAQAGGGATASPAMGQAGIQTGGSGAGQAAGAPASGGQQMQMGGYPGVGQPPMRRQNPGASTALTVTVEGRSETLTAQQLEAMPQRTVTVHNGHTNTDETYSGVAVSDLLAGMGLKLDGADAHAAGSARQRMLRSFVRATGTDFYFVVYSGAELEPTMHAGEVIVATKRNGQGLGDSGQLMLVSTEEKVPARWVRNLTSITLQAID